MEKLAEGATVILYGALLGIGFWASKKLTQKVDDKLAEHDNSLIETIRARYYVKKDDSQPLSVVSP